MSDITVSANVQTMLSAADYAGVRTALSLTALATTTPGTGVATFLTTPSSANLAAAVTGETGSGALVFGTNPTIDGPTLTNTTTAATVTATTLNATSGTLAGTLLLSEGGSLGLDPAGSADGAWSGITMTGTSGYSQAFGDVVMLDPNQSPARWELASVSAAAGAVGDCRGNLAMVVVTGTDGNSCTLLRLGVVRADANFPSLTVNGAVYATTTGDITNTQPSTTDHVIRLLGAALTADEIFFNPDKNWITHT